VIFTETALKGAWIIDVHRIDDDRGFFARSFCKEEFSNHGLKTDVAQCNISYNKVKGTLRGMHFQQQPKKEAKLVRCTRGKIFDVIIDLRPDSSTYCRWEGVELSEDTHRALYIPEGFAHGFQTLENSCEVFYQMYEFFAPECASGVRWDDSAFCINWPLANPIISAKDRSYSDYVRLAL
jgi:dTDP-4-dehydrorhamnose 3,5-epimerase